MDLFSVSHPADRRGPSAPQAIRIFICSTFRDMHAERDQLSRIVFPELRSRCLRRGADCLGVDLRWGVTEEEAEQEGALALCLQEVERCRPFFVCLLGGRFGWVPPPEEVPAPLFETVRGTGELPPMIAECYHLDETAVPSTYRLRRDRKLPNRVAEELPRFWESKGLPLAGDSITAREILRGVFDAGYPAMRHAFFYLRKPGLDQHPAFPESFLPDFVEQDPERRRKLEGLEKRIRAAAGRVSVRDYEAGYAGLRIDAITAHGMVALDGMDALGQQILDDLWPAIEAELEWPAEAVDAHQRERSYHERFAVDRTRLFIGRASETGQAMAYAADIEDRRPLVVTGPPGAGKSAFLAGCVRLCRELHPAALVVPHFIGAAPGSAALPATLRSLCETLRRELALDGDVEADPLKLRAQFGDFLEKAGARRPVILVLDALNQLDSTGRSHKVDWIPYILPPGTKLVVSTLAGDCLEQLRRRVPADHVIDLPALPRDDRRTLVQQFLDARRKKLTAGQLARLLDTGQRPDAGLPLYLLVALEELCLFGDHEALGRRIERLPATLPELFDQVLARLEQDHTRVATESVCSWLAVSRSGLLESEVLDLLGGVFPHIRWTRLYRALAPYLKPMEETTRGGLLDFFHDQLRTAVERRYFDLPSASGETSDRCRDAHRALAGHFRSFAFDPSAPLGWRPDRARALSELPYHQTRAHAWEDLENTLTDLRFLEARCAAGTVFQLVDDYRRAGAAPLRPSLRDFAPFVQRKARILALHPELAFQEAANEPHSSAVAMAAGRLWDNRIEQRPWLKQAAKSRNTDPCIMVVAGGEDCAISPDGLRLATCAAYDVHVYETATGELLRTFDGGRPLAFHPDSRRIVCRSSKRTLTVWDSETGARRLILRGHDWDVAGCAVSSDGRFIVSGSPASRPEDETLKIWDGESGAVIHSIRAGPVWACAITPDGRYTVCGGDHKLKVFELASGTLIKTLGGTVAAMAGNNCALFPDGCRVVSAAIHGLTVWDVSSGAVVLKIKTDHEEEVTACAVSPDGRMILSGSKDALVKLWDAENGTLLSTLWGHEAWVRACTFTPDGKHVVSAGREETTRVTGLAAARDTEPEIDHAAKVNTCTAFRDGSRFVSTSRDGAVRIWRADTGALEQSIASPSRAESSCCAVSPDGRFLLIGYTDNTTRIFDRTTGGLRVLPELGGRSVRQCEIGPDGRCVLLESVFVEGPAGGSTARGSETIIVDLEESGQKVHGFEERSLSIHDIVAAFLPDGRRFASGNPHRTQLRSVDTGELLCDLHVGTARNCLSISPDGCNIAWIQGNGNRLRIFDSATGVLKRETRLAASLAATGGGVAYTPDGRLLAATPYGIVNVLSARDLSPVRSHAGHYAWLRPSPEGQRLLAGGLDGVAVLPLNDEGPILRLRVEGITCGALARDRWVCAGSSGGHVYRLEIMGLPSGAAITTLAHLYDFEKREHQAWATAQCGWCGRRIPAPSSILDVIGAIGRNASLSEGDAPCDKLPDDAWEEPKLLADCSHCGGQLRFNPFIVGR
jgi:telomerase protein component 1